MLTQQELATIRGALRFWKDEIASGDVETANHYLDSPFSEQLDAPQIERLIERLQVTNIRYVRMSEQGHVLAVTRERPDAVHLRQTGTLVLSTGSNHLS